MLATNLTTLFSDIADAIRGKDGTSATIQASTFPARITAIPSGGGHVTIALSGNLMNLDFQGQWDSVFTDNDIDLTFTDVNNLYNAFNNSKLITVDLTGATYKDSNQVGYVNNIGAIFNNCVNLTSVSLPGLIGCIGLNGEPQMFYWCTRLRNIYMPNYITYGGSSMFNHCTSLRQLPFTIQSGQAHINGGGSSIYMQGFMDCYTLDEIVGLGVITPDSGTSIGQFKTNVFSSTFIQCMRLKRMTFATDNGTPKTVNWTNQVISFNGIIGYASSIGNIVNYNSGITADKRVTDATSYDALKNDPDWFTTDLAYSRYNHDSAVETLNSLPDTSAYIATEGGTNTITFKGSMGSATDGGAINTLTSAEIAVATAKGWTVSLV